MATDLVDYYERELSFFRQLGAEFADGHREIAGRLGLGQHETPDPHVERLIQACAFLTARVRHKIDDDFPEITSALLNVLYPHYLAPVPSMSIVQFAVDAIQGGLTSKHVIEQEAMLYSRPVDGAPCRFRTCYPVTLWPIELKSAAFEQVRAKNRPEHAASVLRFELACTPGAELAELGLDELRFFLHGEDSLVYKLYELLFSNVCEVQLQKTDGTLISRHEPSCVSPVGFDFDEGMLPYSDRSFLGYRLLTEYFSFPEKFLFFDVKELASVAREDLDNQFSLCFFLDKQPGLEQPVNQDTFRLGCSPIVNLFQPPSEPLRADHTKSEYRVVPDQRRPNSVEVYSVDRVVSVPADGGPAVHFEPFYAARQSLGDDLPEAYWYVSRRPSERQDDAGTEVYLSIVDVARQPALPPTETLSIAVTCSNRDLPSKLDFGGDDGVFQLEGRAPAIIRCLKPPTKPVRSHLERGAQWRLTSHLSLNYLSLAEAGGDALREMLQLYNLGPDLQARQVNQEHIDGIRSVTAQRIVRRPKQMPWNGFCRGLEVSIDFDEQKFIGGSAFLMASVLEVFMGLYASINSFTEVVATTREGRQELKRWKARSGEQILL